MKRLDERGDIILHLRARNGGKGAAVQDGLKRASGDVVIISMADLSDDTRAIGEMIRLIREEHYDIVCASRYMRGGQHIGGPLLKKTLSRLAGLTLYWLGALPVHDATNAFRAYRREILKSIEIESTGGFEYSLEITAKAKATRRSRKTGT